MVKYGRHLSFFKSEQENEDTPHYVIPYYYLRDKIDQKYTDESKEDSFEDDAVPNSKRPDTYLCCLQKFRNITPTPAESFKKAWLGVLNHASTDYTKATRTCWRTIYAAVSDLPEARGAPLELALQLYTPHVGVKVARDMLKALKSIHATASVNAEGLRKLVKKYDKHVKGNEKLSDVLLPELYVSVVAVGLGMVEMAVEIIRCIIEEIEMEEDDEVGMEIDGVIPVSQQGNDGDDEDEDDTERVISLNDAAITTNTTTITTTTITLDQHQQHQQHQQQQLSQSSNNSAFNPQISMVSVANSTCHRSSEYQWLHSFTSSLPSPTLLSHLVAHRGFHDPGDSTNRRPIENSLQAFESAWSSGIHLCECDVALTKDERIVTSHDENFSRLALDKNAQGGSAKKSVGDLTLKELIALTLKNGVRAPTLIDVLNSARMIGGNAKLVIEIKPGNTEMPKALARLFARYPELMERVALIMSFDLWCMHQLSAELSRVAAHLGWGGAGSNIVGEVGRQSVISNSSGFSRRNSMTMLGMSILGAPLNISIRHNHALPRNSILHQSYMFKMDEEEVPVSKSGDDSKTVLESEDDSKTSSDQSQLPETLPPKRSSFLITKRPQTPPKNHTIKLPNLMLLTMANKPNTKSSRLYVDIGDTSPVDGWLKNNYGNLDGVYMRYQPTMKTPEGAAALRALSKRYKVGIWCLKPEDPDDLETLKYFAEECGVTYYNSDLPRSFL